MNFYKAKRIWNQNRENIEDIIRTDTIKESKFENRRVVGLSEIITPVAEIRNQERSERNKSGRTIGITPLFNTIRLESENILEKKINNENTGADSKKVKLAIGDNRGRRKKYLNNSLKMKKKNFGFRKFYILSGLILLTNLLFNFLLFLQEYNKFKNIENLQNFHRANSDWFSYLYGSSVYMNTAIAFNNTLITSDNKTATDRFYIKEKILKERILPKLDSFEGKEFDKYTDMINFALRDGNICKEKLKRTNCDFAYNGFAKGNLQNLIKGSLSIFRGVVQDYERGDKSEATLRQIINSKSFWDNIANIARVFGPILLWLRADAEFYITKLIEEFKLLNRVTQFVKMFISILAILLSAKISWSFTRPVKVRLILLLKLIPEVSIYENSVLRKKIEGKKSKN